MKHDETVFDKFPGTLLHPRKVLQLVARNICFTIYIYIYNRDIETIDLDLSYQGTQSSNTGYQ